MFLDRKDIEKGFVLLVFLVLLAGIGYFDQENDLSSITGKIVNIGGQCDLSHTIYRMSSSNNAHAQLADHGTGQDYSINACESEDFARQCGANNEHVILWLSDKTNSHVEANKCDNWQNCRSASGSGNYDEKICYEGKYCIYGPYGSDCNGVTGDGVECYGSISGLTNAHVGDCSAYNTKICCGDEPPVPRVDCSIDLMEIYWALDSEGNNGIPGETEVIVNTPVYVIVKEASCTGQVLETLEIYEDDIIGDELEKEFSEEDRTFDENGMISNLWLAKWQDDEFGGDPEYFIKAKLGGEEGKSLLIKVKLSGDGDGGTCDSDGVCEPENGETNPNCGDCYCGDGVIALPETCDDGGTASDNSDDEFPLDKDSCSEHDTWDESEGKLKCSSTNSNERLCDIIDTSLCECNNDGCT